ncbi:MAG TPA: helix-turn-helix transcriptional regulator [Longimicrobium sp.]|nr:helix-turn-helix transcriptional regulator [Longimicrobium sp.]
MENFEAILGQVIATERKRAGLTQEALASRCKLHPTYISQLERGLKSPTVRVLVLVAGAIGTKASEILQRAEELAVS